MLINAGKRVTYPAFRIKTVNGSYLNGSSFN